MWVGYFGFGISNSGAVGFGFVWLIVCFGFSGWLVVLDFGFCGFGGCVSLTCNRAPLRSHDTTCLIKRSSSPPTPLPLISSADMVYPLLAAGDCV